MRVYKAEKDDEIDFQIDQVGNSSLSITAQIHVGDIEKYFDGMSIAELTKTTSTVQSVEELIGQEQPDLALIVAILVSTGWNLNDDIFTPDEVWKARSTPLHKPINDKHQANKILGHIVKTRVLDKSGVDIEVADGESPPVEFDIEVAGVLYRASPELVKRIDEIITKAKIGEMFVSMEAWFPDFGYGLIDHTTGDTKLVQRNENTAFLTKHLRIYGGTGHYQGYRIGRVLKDIVFSAQGLVDTPANPESVIKVVATERVALRSFVTAKLSDLSEGGVEGMTDKQLQEKLEEAQTSLESKIKEMEAFRAKDYEGQIAALNTKVEELTVSVTEALEKVEVVEAAKVELQEQFTEVTERADKSEAELDDIRKTELGRERMLKLSKVKKIDSEKTTLAELRGMTDETFEVVLKYAGEAKSKEPEKTETDGEEEAELAEAALNDVEEEDSAELNVAENAVESEANQWLSVAGALCGREDKKNEGGE